MKATSNFAFVGVFTVLCTAHNTVNTPTKAVDRADMTSRSCTVMAALEPALVAKQNGLDKMPAIFVWTKKALKMAIGSIS